MFSVSCSRRIAAPVSHVFDVCTDLDRAAERLSQVTKIEKLTPGPVGVGTRFKETRKMMGHEATETMEFVVFEPNRRYAVTANSCGAAYRTEFRFDQDGDGTLATMSFSAKPVTLFARLMAPIGRMMMGSMAKKCFTIDLDDLAKAAESQPVPPV